MSESPAYVIAGAAWPGPRPRKPCARKDFTTHCPDRRGDRTAVRAAGLSKDYLLGKAEREAIYVHPA